MDSKKKSDDRNSAEHGEGSGKYPKAIYFILGNEFCERFTYYGIRTISSLYLTQYLIFSDDTATVIFHFFVMLAYFTPLLGAILADSWLGKYKTILYLSVLYAIGNIVLSAGAIPASLQTMRYVSILGFIIVGIGTGGIKPCVAAFGGDQFSHTQENQRKLFFSIFYFIINFGSTLSTIITPELRANVHCFGENTCYPLAFGVPSLLMIVSIVLFVSGKSLYTMIPVTGNAVVKVGKCVSHAIAKKFNSKEKKKEHFLDYAEDQYEKTFIDDVKSLLHVLWIFLPLPIFWSLFDQTSSRWTLQATRMDGEFYGTHIQPDQMQAVNPIMILIFIPVFDYIVYPLLNKCKILTKPLQRMTVGGLLSAASFILAGMLEMSLESALPSVPPTGFSELSIINNSPCKLFVNGTIAKSVSPIQYEFLTNLPLDKESSWEFKPRDCAISKSVLKSFTSRSQYEIVVISEYKGELQVNKVTDKKTKSNNGEPRIRLFYSTDVDYSPTMNLTFKLESKDKTFFIPFYIENSTTFGWTFYTAVTPGTYKIYLPMSYSGYETEPIAEENFRNGGSYIGLIYKNSSMAKLSVFQNVKANSIHILWQIPQYIVITAGEIMFSITGLEFSYSQAPLSLKSVVQSAWLFTVAVGNAIVMIVAKSQLFNKQSHELLMYAAIMILDMLIFMVMAYFYKYKTVQTPSQEGLDTAGTVKPKNNEDETGFNK